MEDMWVWIHDSQRWWAAALWATLEGCCFVWAAAGGSRPWLFAACELEPFWLINKLPGVFNDLVQVAACTFSGIMKWLVYMWPTHGNMSKTKPIILLLQYYFGDWQVCLSQKLNVFLFWMQKGLCSHTGGSRSWFYLTNRSTSQVQPLSIQSSQLLLKCKQLLIRNLGHVL